MSDLTRADILRHALEITQEYVDDGLDLTLRQVYYQFVGRGLAGSGNAVYKRIGDVLTEARYDGSFPLEWLVDRGRHVQHGSFTRNDHDEDRALREVAGLVRALPSLTLQTDRWYGQPVHVSVWFEKEALAGVFGPVCDELGVGWFALKGYPSVSALHDWLKQTDIVLDNQQRQPRYHVGGMDADHRGERRARIVALDHVRWGTSDWHPGNGSAWFLQALDVEREDCPMRDFDLAMVKRA